MTEESRPFLHELHAILAAWQKRHRLSDLLPPLFSWWLPRWGAERVILFSELPDGSYQIWGARTHDGETIPDAEQSISQFAVMRAAGSDEPTHFPETRADRRFRTQSEQARGVKSRSILIVPLGIGAQRTSLYFDSRFREIEVPSEEDHDWPVARATLALALAAEEEKRRRSEAERTLKRRELSAAKRSAPKERKPTRHRRPAADPIDFHGFLTRSTALIEGIRELERLAPSDVPILIEGESGTGKDLLARAIHAASGREGPFVILSCASIPETLVEVELFGHREGAFTGADRERAGLLAHAEGGTLYLDRVEEASPVLQAALLRVLETGRYRPLAGEDELEIDVRIVSSHLLTSEEESDPDLRGDLYYRLAGSKIVVPPLRERREDIVPIARRLFAQAMGKRSIPPFDDRTEEALLSLDWPGNARQLESEARRQVALDEPTLSAERLFESLGVERLVPKIEGELPKVIGQAEREAILRALTEAAGNKSVAAKLLGMSRRTFYRRMEKHGIPL